MRTLLWFRGKDLRLSDHAALTEALGSDELIPLFVLDPYFFAPARAQAHAHRSQFLLESLSALEQNIAARGSKLLVVAGKSTQLVPELARRWKVDRILAQRWVEPFARERDQQVAEASPVPFELHEGETLLPPGTLRTGAGRPYSVYSHFARAFRELAQIGVPLPAPKIWPKLPRGLRAERAAIPSLAELGITPNPRLIKGGEAEAQLRLRRFFGGPASHYPRGRDRLAEPGTSRLAADLKFGTLSARTVWHETQQQLGRSASGKVFANELIWRELSHSTLWDRPELLETSFRPEFADFPWREDERLWRAWAEGRTGYPVVDAAARQLLGEGFVHNRARMIAASFLTKHLLISYRRGEAHYMKYLADGDWAQNNFNWQWCAGCGCDAQPYFRIFNPMLQGKRFDPNGDYVRRWLPELSDVPNRYIHEPWQAPDAVLENAGLRLGHDYPRPIVDHPEARAHFLAVAKAHLRRRP